LLGRSFPQRFVSTQASRHSRPAALIFIYPKNDQSTHHHPHTQAETDEKQQGHGKAAAACGTEETLGRYHSTCQQRSEAILPV